MKFIPIPELSRVNQTLKFTTSEISVEGSCDIYITKSTKADRKTYNRIDEQLQTEYEALLKETAALSPAQGAAAGLSTKLARASAFGPLSQARNRKTFADLIVAMNDTHSDYDFSYDVKPSDFRRESDLPQLMQDIDAKLIGLWPRPQLVYDSPRWTSSITPTTDALLSSQRWSSRVWPVIDKEMDLWRCEVYSISPDKEVFDTSESVMWSMNYFFYNKTSKRVCYLYVKGINILSLNAGLLDIEDLTMDSESLDGAEEKELEDYYTCLRERSLSVEGSWDEDNDADMFTPSIRRPRRFNPYYHESASLKRDMSDDILDSMEF